ncbi:MAG: TlpA disulfide reductase family protein [Bacteroidia bacterium]
MKSIPFHKSLRSVHTLAAAALISAAALTGCGGGGSSDGSLVINGTLSGCTGDSIRLFSVSGTRINQVAAAKLDAADGKGKFSLNYKLSKPGFYLIGIEPRQSANVVLGEGGTAEMTGDCMNPQSFRLTGHNPNDTYNRLQERVSSHNQQLQGLYQNLQIFAQTDPMQVNRIQGDIKKLNDTHFAYLDSLQKSGGFMGKVAQMYNFKPFMSDPSHSVYSTELDYFRAAFFENLDFKDPEVGGMPQLYDKARAYTGTLAGQGLPADVIKTSVDGVLGKTTSGSEAHESLLRGFVVGFEQTKNALLIEYGKQYINAYPQSDPQFIASLNNTIRQLEGMAVGALAPEIEAPTPAGKALKLSDFRGKVVLIDFWASWCRPCRMENPNVVKAYNKYHPKGFEILGVSLDDNKEKWETAIKQDGLIWNHISDLRGWQAQPAQVYGVNSIPATVLVDREGKILARNLRGPALEAKLAELFGS